jgi:heptosyltransferase-2/heptosyltransferase-3
MTRVLQDVTRVAIIKPCCIGDCVMALPALDAVADRYPGARLDVVVGEHSRAVFTHHPRVARTIRCPNGLAFSSAVGLAGRLRRERYDLALAFDRSRWVGVALRLARPRFSRQATSHRPESRHESDVYLDVARSVDATASPRIPRLVLPETARERAQSVTMATRSPFVVLQPGGARNPGSTMLDKRWPAERYADLARWFTKQGLAVLITGSRDDRALGLAITQQAGLSEEIVLAGSLDLLATAAVIELAAQYVGGDTGVSHLAAAAGTPCIVIFGPTNPRRYAPLGERVSILAPPESWSIPDVDLRKRDRHAVGPRTADVSVSDVIAACAAQLADRMESSP